MPTAAESGTPDDNRPTPSGLCVVDKPSGWTSHDVVSRIRRLAGTRRVGHAGTLDPMATGVLVVGIERATKLLGLLALTDKSYEATIRLGQATVTDDAQGLVTSSASTDDLSDEAIRGALHLFEGELHQIPSSVSAIKVDGRRAYSRVRAGEQVELKPRRVTVGRLEVTGIRRERPHLVDVDVAMDCSTGTYVRAVARDLGTALGVGGHLTALRRTRVGPFDISQARSLEQLAELPSPVLIELSEAVAACFTRRDVGELEAIRVSHGRRLDAVGIPGTYGVFDPDGHAVALVEEGEDGDGARPVVVLRPANAL